MSDDSIKLIIQPENNAAFLYIMREPRPDHSRFGEPRYVGKTCQTLKKRFIQHLCDAKHGKRRHLYNCFRACMESGHIPAVEYIAEVWGYGGMQEQELMKQYKTKGYDLVNATEGGEGVPGHIHSPETRLKISSRLKKYCSDPKVRHRMSLMAKGQTYSEEMREKRRERSNRMWSDPEFKVRMSAKRKGHIGYWTGKKMSQEHKDKISKAQKGKPKHKAPMSQATKDKIRLANKGKHRNKPSDQTRMKMSERIKNAWRNPRYRSRMSEAHKGKHVSDETRKKLSERTKAYWARKRSCQMTA